MNGLVEFQVKVKKNMSAIAIIIITNVIAGVILGFIWRWHIMGLIFAALSIGAIAVVTGGDWSEFRLLFSSPAAFVWICFKYFVFFGFMIGLVIVSALLTFLFKERISSK